MSASKFIAGVGGRTSAALVGVSRKLDLLACGSRGPGSVSALLAGSTSSVAVPARAEAR
jgi:hypothetical protein